MKMFTASLFLFLAVCIAPLRTARAQTPAARRPPKAVEMLDPAFQKNLSPDAVLKTVFTGMEGSFFEGPTWVVGRPGHLIFTDIPHT